jgi:hypothetical protein
MTIFMKASRSSRAAMQIVRSRRRRQAALLAALLLILLATAMPAAAIDLFARHEVTVQFATADGRPMGDAEVRVFAPGEPGRPALTGRTDRDGKFAFAADRDGMWTAEARNGSEVARATVRVSGAAPQQEPEPLSPYLLVGALLLLLILAFGFRVLRARARRPRSGKAR